MEKDEKRMLGCDVSRNNGANAVLDAIGSHGDIKFVIAKATEGRTYKDSMFDNNIKTAMLNNRLVGAYHYARPDNKNTPEQEALNFVNAVRPYIGKIMLALDWEDKSLKCSPSWALEWCKCVERMTGVKPLIYIQESYVQKVGAVFSGEDYGLWVAKWGDSPRVQPAWKFWALWQYTNSKGVLDLNWFNGTVEQFKKYCESSIVENEDFCECRCHYCGCCNKGE